MQPTGFNASVLAYSRAAFPGLLVWAGLWWIDGRPYGPLPWVAGCLLIAIVAAPLLPRRPFLVGTAGFACGACLWAVWRLTDGSTGPALTGSPLSARILPYAVAAGCVSTAACLMGWPVDRRSGIGWFLASFAMVCTVGALSGQAGGPGNAQSWLETLLHLSPQAAEAIIIGARKAIHLLFYGCLGWSTFWWAWHSGLSAERAASCGIALATTLGIFDELRQAHAFGRTGKPADAAIDLLGAGLFVYMALRAARARETVLPVRRRPISNRTAGRS